MVSYRNISLSLGKLAATLALFPAVASAQPVYWLNAFDLLPGDPTVATEVRAIDCPGVSGLAGVGITSSTLGEQGPDGENKVVFMGAPVPPDFDVNGVRVCYENTSAASYVSQVRLCELNSPSNTCTVRLDDGTDLTDPGPLCVNSAAPFGGAIEADTDDPNVEGALQLSLRVNFGDLADTICVRGVGLVGTSPEKGAARCTDGIDNDGDGDTDCADSACSDRPFCS